MIAIIDYGMGNLRSVQKAFEKVGFPAVVTDDPAQVAATNARLEALVLELEQAYARWELLEDLAG